MGWVFEGLGMGLRGERGGQVFRMHVVFISVLS